MVKWECRDLGTLTEFLQMHIIWQEQQICINQSNYLKKVLQRFCIQDTQPAPTPLSTGYYLQKHIGSINYNLQKKFQTLIRSLLYLMLETRPDIAFAITQLAQHIANLFLDHFNQALYVCCYLVGTQDYSLIYKGEIGLGISAYIDSDQVSNPKDHRSQTGYFLTITGDTFSWISKAQRTIALSSTKAKYIALSDCSQQYIWIRSILLEIGYKFGPIYINGNNQSSIFMSSNPVTESQNKYINVHFYAICNFVAQGKVRLFYIEGNENMANLFTKNLSPVKFWKFRDQLGLVFDQGAALCINFLLTCTTIH